MPIKGNWLGSGHPSPYQQVSAVLSGAASYDEVPDAIRSLLRKPIHDMAVKIIREGDKEKRRKMLTDAPDGYRTVLEQRVRELWPIRQRLLK